RHPANRIARLARRSVLFVDHETRLSGGELDLVDLVRGIVEEPEGRSLDLHVVLPDHGPLATTLERHGVTVHHFDMAPDARTTSRWELAKRPGTPVRLSRELAGAARSLDRVVREVRPDILHSNSMKTHLLTT